jgi:hypothetical protein
VSQTLYVAWRSGSDSQGRWGPVGRLKRDENVYRFLYTRGARTLAGFQPFPGMPNLEAIYESDELLPLFANRLLARSRPEYERFLVWGGFDPDNPPDPIALLGVTEGRRATDSIEVFPCPAPDVQGCYLMKFFVHGIRWMAPAALDRIAILQPGEQLVLMLDIMNSHDSHAVAIRTSDVQGRLLIGHVPRYLAHDISQLCLTCEPDFLTITVERVNSDAPLQQRLLCRMNACWPEGFQPCSGEEYQPLVNLSGQLVD